jgi:hypothetical protein
MGGALKFLSLATALLSPLVQSLNVPEAQKVPGAYIVEFADNGVSIQATYSFLHRLIQYRLRPDSTISLTMPERNTNIGWTCLMTCSRVHRSGLRT